MLTTVKGELLMAITAWVPRGFSLSSFAIWGYFFKVILHHQLHLCTFGSFGIHVQNSRNDWNPRNCEHLFVVHSISLLCRMFECWWLRMNCSSSDTDKIKSRFNLPRSIYNIPWHRFIVVSKRELKRQTINSLAQFFLLYLFFKAGN